MSRAVAVSPETPRPYGYVASFAGPAELLHAAAKLKEAGYSRYDAHSPFPIHGMDEAMGEKRSRVSYFAAAAAILGGSALLGLIYYAHVIDYPIVISGKPMFSYQAFFPPIFAICVLSAAFGALLSMAGFIKLKLHHPVFESRLFPTASDDGFLIAVEADDSLFDSGKTKDLLASLGAKEIELVQGGSR